jgi:hypothetical protein
LQQTLGIFDDDVIEILMEIDDAFSLTKSDVKDFPIPTISTPLDLINYVNIIISKKQNSGIIS